MGSGLYFRRIRLRNVLAISTAVFLSSFDSAAQSPCARLCGTPVFLSSMARVKVGLEHLSHRLGSNSDRFRFFVSFTMMTSTRGGRAEICPASAPPSLLRPAGGLRMMRRFGCGRVSPTPLGTFAVLEPRLRRAIVKLPACCASGLLALPSGSCLTVQPSGVLAGFGTDSRMHELSR